MTTAVSYFVVIFLLEVDHTLNSGLDKRSRDGKGVFSFSIFSTKGAINKERPRMLGAISNQKANKKCYA